MRIKNNHKYLIAVSGGCDSMYLLYTYRNKNVIVAFVDYNLRQESKIEKAIVKTFCSRYSIPFFSLLVTEKKQGNFQSWARNIRYEFFKKIYKENNCNFLLVAHHKDDFLETALFQENSNRRTYFYGIKKTLYNFEMNIYRPLIDKLYKKEIREFMLKKKIAFNDDKSNFEQYYQRNILRETLMRLSRAEKDILIASFLKKNKELKIQEIKAYEKFEKWKYTNFSKEFLKQEKTLQFDLMLLFLYHAKYQIKVSKSKIENLLLFIFSENESKKVRIMQDIYLFKNKNNIYVAKLGKNNE